MILMYISVLMTERDSKDRHSKEKEKSKRKDKDTVSSVRSNDILSFFGRCQVNGLHWRIQLLLNFRDLLAL